MEIKISIPISIPIDGNNTDDDDDDDDGVMLSTWCQHRAEFVFLRNDFRYHIRVLSN